MSMSIQKPLIVNSEINTLAQEDPIRQSADGIKKTGSVKNAHSAGGQSMFMFGKSKNKEVFETMQS